MRTLRQASMKDGDKHSGQTSQIRRLPHKPALTTFLEFPEVVPTALLFARPEQHPCAANLCLPGIHRHQLDMLDMEALQCPRVGQHGCIEDIERFMR